MLKKLQSYKTQKRAMKPLDQSMNLAENTIRYTKYSLMLIKQPNSDQLYDKLADVDRKVQSVCDQLNLMTGEQPQENLTMARYR